MGFFTIDRIMLVMDFIICYSAIYAIVLYRFGESTFLSDGKRYYGSEK